MTEDGDIPHLPYKKERAIMAKYLGKRLLHGLISIIIVVGIVMSLIYSLMDRNLIFAKDSTYSHQKNNAKVTYSYQKWEEYGYLDYVTYEDYIQKLAKDGEIDEETRSLAIAYGRTKNDDSDIVKEYIVKFVNEYKAKGYSIKRLDAVMMNERKCADGGQQAIFAYKDVPLFKRLWDYFSHIITVDSVDNVKNIEGKRGISFTWYDPVYGPERYR